MLKAITNGVGKYFDLSNKDVWMVRYAIAIGLLIFFCYEAHLSIVACIKDSDCLRSDSLKEIFHGLKNGIFWTFVVVILGKAVVPLINRFAALRFGGGPIDPAVQTTKTEKTETSVITTPVPGAPTPAPGG